MHKIPKRRVFSIILIWVIAISSIIIIYYVRDKSPVKEFLEWAKDTSWVIVGIFTAAVGLSALAIKSNAQFLKDSPIENGDSSKYEPEWQHFEKLKDAIIKLEYATAKERRNLVSIIENERVYIGDDDFQQSLSLFIGIITEKFFDTDMSVFHDIIRLEIDRETKRMNKRYKR